MSNAFADTWFMTQRHLRNLFRQPAWIVISLVQPIVWLLLYGALFRKIVEIPGFGAGSYIDFLTPGIVVMTCLFSAGWSGMGLIDDIDRGVVDRFLVSPASRGSLISGRLVQGAIVGVIQSAIIIVLGLIIGAQYPGGIAGIVALTICAVLLGTSIGALSNAVALLSRKEETMIAVSNFVLLPLVFLSSVFMAQALMPGWMQGVARYNPVNWAVDAGAVGTRRQPRLEPRLHAHGLARAVHDRLLVAGDARVPRVPAVDLRECAPRAGTVSKRPGGGSLPPGRRPWPRHWGSMSTVAAPFGTTTRSVSPRGLTPRRRRFTSTSASVGRRHRRARGW